MFRHNPTDKSRKWYWLAAFVWMGVTFLTIPFARDIQRGFERLLGSNVYQTASLIAGFFFGIMVLAYIFRRRKKNVARRVGWLIILLSASAWLMPFQLQTPAEAIHFFQYGILSLLLFLAWSHHIRDRLVYPVCVITAMIAASLDEFLQWLMPGRYWDIRDIRLNLLAAMILQFFIAFVIVPSAIDRKIERRSIRILCSLSLVALSILLFVFSNTPSRVDLYATRIPFMQFLVNNESVMSEYGYRHRDPETGTFYSRFTQAQLIETDRERGAAVGETILRYQNLLDYREFLQRFTSTVDPFLHEMRVHLNRRDHYLETAMQYAEKDPDRLVYHMTVAHYENLLLEKYFAHALTSSGQALSPELKAEIRANADLTRGYTSPVSDHLVTVATELEFRLVLGGLFLLVLIVYLRCGRRKAGSDGICGYD